MDERTLEEYKRSKIKGVTHIPLNTLVEKIEQEGFRLTPESVSNLKSPFDLGELTRKIAFLLK